MNHGRLRPRPAGYSQLFQRVNSCEEFENIEKGDSILSGQTSVIVALTGCAATKQTSAASSPKGLHQHQQGSYASSMIEGKGQTIEKQATSEGKVSSGERDVIRGHWSGGGRDRGNVYGYIYKRLHREEVVPREDAYELTIEDMEMLEKLNVSKREESEKINCELASEVFVHFEKRSTRMTTATMEEVKVEVPPQIKRGLSESEMVLFYEYWKAKRECVANFLQGDAERVQDKGTTNGGSVFNKYPFIRRFWRASADEGNLHQAFRPREVVRIRTRKSARPEVKEIVNDRIIMLSTEIEQCQIIAAAVAKREKIKRDLAILHVSEILNDLPSEVRSFIGFTSEEGGRTKRKKKKNLQGLVSQEEMGSEFKRRKKKKKAVEDGECTGVEQQSNYQQPYSGNMIKLSLPPSVMLEKIVVRLEEGGGANLSPPSTDVIGGKASRQQSYQRGNAAVAGNGEDTMFPTRDQSVGDGRSINQEGHSAVGLAAVLEQTARGSKEDKVLVKKMKKVKDVGKKQRRSKGLKQDGGLYSSEQTGVDADSSVFSAVGNSMKSLVGARNADQQESRVVATLIGQMKGGGEEILSVREDDGQQSVREENDAGEAVMRMGREAEVARFLGSLIAYYERERVKSKELDTAALSMSMPIVVDNARSGEEVVERNEQILAAKMHRLSHVNCLAFNIRKRIGRSGRVYLDRICAKSAVELTGDVSWAGRAKYILKPHTQEILYNTFGVLDYVHEERSRAQAELAKIPGNNNNRVSKKLVNGGKVNSVRSQERIDQIVQAEVRRVQTIRDERKQCWNGGVKNAGETESEGEEENSGNSSCFLQSLKSIRERLVEKRQLKEKERYERICEQSNEVSVVIEQKVNAVVEWGKVSKMKEQEVSVVIEQEVSLVMQQEVIMMMEQKVIEMIKQDVSAVIEQEVSAVMEQEVCTAKQQEVSAVIEQEVSAVMESKCEYSMAKELLQMLDPQPTKKPEGVFGDFEIEGQNSGFNAYIYQKLQQNVITEDYLKQQPMEDISASQISKELMNE